MRLIILGSSSAGNCYLLQNDEETLIIEAGVKFSDIKKGLGFNLSCVVGCLITHEHGDHSKGAKDMLNAGIEIYTSYPTALALGISPHHRCMPVKAGKKFKIGGFTVLPFDVKHDAAGPFGFIINHDETGNVLFLTDTYYVEYTFANLHNIIVEANYSQEILNERLRKGESPEFLRNRVLQSHMSLNTCKDLLKANDLSKVNNIVLIHLSDSNSNASVFLKEVQECTGKRVHIADKGVIIENFNKSPF